MLRKNKNELHVIDLRYVVEEAKTRIPNGEARFAVSDFPLSHTCFSFQCGPNMSEILSSNLSISSENEEIEKQYYEEIKVLEEIMVETDTPINLAEWQRGSAESVMKGMNLRAYAMQIWDWYAIPWRLDGETVYIIYSPQDVMGSPIIHTWPATNFFEALAKTASKQNSDLENLDKKLSFWKNFGIIILVVVAIVTWGYIQNLLAR